MINCIILTALFVNGLSISTDSGMIFEHVKAWIKSKIGERKIYKPIIGCVRCMPSIYGTIIYLLMMPIDINIVWQLPIVIVASVSLSAVINSEYI
jgi:hypothetical protein